MLYVFENLSSQSNTAVIVTDWREGAREINYLQSVASARVVGAQVAQLITVLETSHGISLDDVHIIGHSLGAHIAGYAGERLNRVARITGSWSQFNHHTSSVKYRVQSSIDR